MPLPSDLKICVLHYSDEVSVPFIVSDELYYNPSSYAVAPTYDWTKANLSSALEYFKTIPELDYFFSMLPILYHDTTLSDISEFANLYTRKQTTTFTGNLQIGNQTQTFSYDATASDKAYYRNSSTSTSRTFPTQYCYMTSGIVNSKPIYNFNIDFSILPNECVVDGNLNLSSSIEPQTGSVNLMYRQDGTQTYYQIAFNHASNVHYYNWYVLDGLSVEEILPPQPVNFYANPNEYNTNKGETVTPNFVMVYEDGNIVEPYTDVKYDDSAYFQNNIVSLSDDGISIIISPDIKYAKRLDFIVRPNIPDTELWTIFHIIVDDVENPYYDENSSGTGGGNGSYGQGENYFDTIGKIPDGSAEANDSRGTMYTRYLVSLNEMSVLGEWLWADDLGLQIAKTAISLLYGDPVQTVISCVSYPFNLSPLVSSSSTSFHWGGHDAGFSLSALNQNAFSIDWGTIRISEYWGNFLDYSPHTQMQLYLPWGTGFVHIDPNDILKSNSSFDGSGTLGIKTNVDLSRGICVHNVIANNTVIGSYSGSCGRQIPITGSDYASKQVSMAGAAIGAMVAGGVVAGSAYSQYSNLEAVPSPTGRYSGGASDGILRRQDAAGRYHDMRTGRFVSAPTPRRYDVVHGEVDKGSMTRLAANASRPAVASAASILVSPPSVSRSGSFQEGAGSLSIQQPYLIISRPKMSMPNNYGHLYGYPSNIYAYLGSLTGYTEVGAVHLDGLPATAEEISEIDSLLKGGVIL